MVSEAPQDNLTDPQAIAKAAIGHMHHHDAFSRHLGIELLETGVGYAKVRMTLRADMMNGHGFCHGGVTYAMADTVFAFACNSRNRKNVAHVCQITYTAPVFEGDTLIATATEQHRGNRSGAYEVMITNQHEKLVAIFKGHAFQLNEPTIPV